METINTTPVNLRSEAVKNGVIMAAVSIVIFLVTNYVLPDMMGSTIFSVMTMLIGIALAVFFCLDMRKKAGGYWTFSEALLHIFIMFLVSAGIVYIFTILFGKYIDTTYPERMKEMISTKTEAMLSKFGMEESKLEEMKEAQAKKLDEQFNPTFFQGIVGFGIQAIMYGVGALIFAAIFKKNQPLFPQNEE
jgi:hypothetical protein